jgi:hypothetical protein
MRRRIALALAAAVAVLAADRIVRADVEVDWGAFIENDLRASVDRVDTPGIERNQTTLGLDLNAALIPDALRFVGDVEFVWTGFARDTEFEGLTRRDTVAPFYLESQSAFVEVIDILPSVDLRVGRQIVQWGTADVFNPTSNLNPPDMEDPLKFGELIANEMVRVDWNPGASSFIVSAVWVPVFEPALLPSSALLQIGDRQSMFPFVDPETRLAAERFRNMYLRNPAYYDVSAPHVTADMPDFSLADSQVGVRMSWLVGMFDTSLSYYYGFNPFPVPVTSASSAARTSETAPDGTPVLGVDTAVKVVYPRKHVLGFDLAGQIPFLDDAGVWFEGALVFPERVRMDFDITEVVPSAELITGDVVEARPFVKYTVGADYTINEYLFVTAQFIHGFIDEFSASAIQDYWMVNCDIKLLREKLLIRLSAIGEVPHEDDDLALDDDGDGRPESLAIGATNDGTIASLVLTPTITLRPMDGLELALGSYFLLGHEEGKFGMPAAGPSLAYFRAKASF